MTLKQFEAFYWAATCASFAVAAERLHLSVSSLSKRIAELESSLGQPLFDRRSYRAGLTAAGSALLPRAQDLLERAEAMHHVLLGDAHLQGRLRFGVGELASQTWLPGMMATAAQRHPCLHLEPVVDTGAQMEQRLEDGELDFAVVAGSSPRDALLSRFIGHAGFDWVAAPGMEEVAEPSGALAAWPLVTMPQGAGTHRMLDEWLARTGHVVRRRVTCNTWGAVAGLLAEGLGVGFLPQGWARPLLARGSLRALADWPALSPLNYAFQVRRDDGRAVLASVRGLLAQTVDFALPIRFLSQ
ncbi:LysR family transcriptional regulator [Xylophilus sp.]|uniref:LysR family transcriptional regulator n=1 Tax=Xylophilus sp. TaxID=2653893 RepID=UPI0013B80C18|nr:LysR family transcriptional regulator [Xylophilus sp.]KAF1042265.1 MAG: HTH-type transcriptional activator CmpR [Xylophilus sp.]